jgi:activator of 2-hydroxyglutaryl-CoA dehydratase
MAVVGIDLGSQSTKVVILEIVGASGAALVAQQVGATC